MVMPYHLHMPSYFLETFTEYPYMERFGHVGVGSCFQTFQIVFLPCLGGEQYYRDVVQVHILLYFAA